MDSHSVPITLARLQELLDYNPETGEFLWRIRRGKKAEGSSAGCVAPIGYVMMRVDGHLHYAHRLAWLYATGEWPKHQIDHINGVRSDNRIANLREVSSSENARNKARSGKNTSGYVGVHWFKPTRKWRASLVVGGKTFICSYFDTIEEAASARRQAEIDAGFHVNHGRTGVLYAR